MINFHVIKNEMNQRWAKSYNVKLLENKDGESEFFRLPHRHNSIYRKFIKPN